jgi:hypothetical protein
MPYTNSNGDNAPMRAITIMSRIIESRLKEAEIGEWFSRHQTKSVTQNSSFAPIFMEILGMF